MSADLIRLGLMLLMVPPTITNTLIFGLTSPWYRTTIGWWLFLDVLGLMLLVVVSVLYRYFGDDYPGRDVVSISIFLIILCGQWFGTFTLVRALVVQRRQDHAKTQEG
jgi:small-conductance mechanosensitive channel